MTKANVQDKGRGLAYAGADAHPCALMNRVMPAAVLVVQACLARGGGWARLSLAVSAPSKLGASDKVAVLVG